MDTSIESHTRSHRRWILGRYLQLVALLQVVVYATAAGASDPNPGLMYLDPRLLLHLVYSASVPGRQPFPSVVSWLSAMMVLCLGEAVVRSRGGLAVYAVIESAFATIWCVIAFLVIASGISPTQGFAAHELIVPFAAFCVGAVAPLLVALPLWRAPDYGD